MPNDTNVPVTVLLESVSEHAYEKIIVAPDQVIITSPYLTSDIAEKVVGAANPNTSTILTTFKAEIFAAKASSLSTLRTLIQKGFNLRYLDGLHAKIVLTREACFVGSQNLTVGGTLNKEATALVTNPSTVAAVADGLHAWVKHSQPITLEMIDDMEKEIGPLIASSDKLATAVNAVDQTVRAVESRRFEIRRRLKEAKQRQEEQRKTEELLRHARESYAALQSNVSKAPIKGSVWLTLQIAGGPSWSSGVYTLMAPANKDLRYWEDYTLTKRDRYLVIVPETGKLGWPALNKTRLTRFGVGLKPSNSDISIGNTSWRIVEVNFNENLESLADWNVQFILSWAPEFAKVDLKAKFTLHGLELAVLKELEGYPTPRKHFAALSSDLDRYSYWLTRELLSSFRYKSNGLGVAADRFCQGLPEVLRLRLRSHKGRSFFSLESK